MTLENVMPMLRNFYKRSFKMSFKGEKYDAHSDTQLSSLQCDGNLLPKIQKLKMNVRLMLVHLVYYCLRNNVAGCKVWGEKRDTIKTWPIVKNPQFLFYYHETLRKWLSQEVIIFNKFHEERTKNMDFYLGHSWLIYKCVLFFFRL